MLRVFRLSKETTWLEPLKILVLWGVVLWLMSLIVPAFPSPWECWNVLRAQPDLLPALGKSLLRMLVGYLLVMVIGITGGLLLGRIPLFDQLMGSFAVAIHAIPGAAWVPLSILWFGMTEQAVVFTILLGASGIVMVQTDTGIREVPPLIARASRTMGAKGLKYFWFVVVPSAIPKMVDGLRLAWAFGWRALMAGELLTSISGLGQLLNRAAKAGQMDQLLAMMFLIASIGILIDGFLFKRLEYEVRVRWGLA